MKDKKHFKKALKREKKERERQVKRWEKAHRKEREAEAEELAKPYSAYELMCITDEADQRARRVLGTPFE